MAENSNKKCVLCPSYCKKCQIIVQIINGTKLENFVCKDGCYKIDYLNRNDKDYLGCPCLHGFVDNKLQNDKCLPCHFSCETCYGITKYDCL